jgi:hypothetical protein
MKASEEVATDCDVFGLSGEGGILLRNAHSTSATFARPCCADSFASCAATISFRHDVVRYAPFLPPNASPNTHAPTLTSPQVPTL